jgi:hypothetical protein
VDDLLVPQLRLHVDLLAQPQPTAETETR